MANAGLDAKTIEIVKSTVPVLEQHGNAITKRFYEMMLSEVPELLSLTFLFSNSPIIFSL